MRNLHTSAAASKAPRSRSDFERVRDSWLDLCWSSPKRPLSAKLLAAALARQFNWKRWQRTGRLDAGGQGGEHGGVGYRYLSEKTGLSFQTLSRAQKLLVRAGLLRIERNHNREYDPATGLREANIYFALFPRRAAQLTPREQDQLTSRDLDEQQDQLTSSSLFQITPREHNLWRTSDLNIPRASLSASSGDEANAVDKKVKQESGCPNKEGSSSDVQHEHRASFTRDDVDFVQEMLLCSGPMTVAKIVAMCQQTAGLYPVNGRQVGAMIKAGHLIRIGRVVEPPWRAPTLVEVTDPTEIATIRAAIARNDQQVELLKRALAEQSGGPKLRKAS
jgi:hypothetical protein